MALTERWTPWRAVSSSYEIRYRYRRYSGGWAYVGLQARPRERTPGV